LSSLQKELTFSTEDHIFVGSYCILQYAIYSV
jgi:hypothetical protein